MVEAPFDTEDDVMDATGNPSEPDPSQLDPYGAADRVDAGTPDTNDAATSTDTVSDDVVSAAADTDTSPAASISDTVSDTVSDAGDATPPPEELDSQIDSSLTDDDFDKFVNDDRPGGFEDVLSRPPTPPPPPPVGPPIVGRKLVRDPYARLGGVCSGLAHYFGLDVILVRVAVLLGSVITGIGFLVYFIAWAVIPRAKMWPPAGRVPGDPGSSISNRNMAVGLVVLGLLIFMGVAGGPGEILVPIALVAGGVMLLRQSPAPTPVPAGAYAGAATVPPPPGAAPWPQTIPQPVPGRSWSRRIGRVGAIAMIVLLPLGAMAGIGAVIFASDDFNGFEFDEEGFGFAVDQGGDNAIRPLTADALQSSYGANAGVFHLDLRELDDSMFTETFDVDVDMDVGELKVLVPDDLTVAVAAESNLGDLSVFGSHREGVNEELNIGASNPSLQLDLNLNLGEIEVVRSN